jgi:kinesin family protein 4/21/27
VHETNKERDSAQAEVARLRWQLEEAQKEVSNVRNSVIVEKQSLEDRLSEERRAKERARAQLEQRLNEVTQQKQSSKFKVRAGASAVALCTIC